MAQAYSAKVAKFRFCSRRDCPGFDNAQPHLLVSTKLVSMEQGNARAISYAWGEFNRQQHSIGHFEDGRLASMELGEDWPVSQFQQTLERLCHESVNPQRYTSSPCTQWCWIDQICISQNDPADVRNTLARIPDIYRTFEVFIILPGPRCSCFESLSVEGQRRKRPQEVLEARDGSELHDLYLSRKCWGILAVYGWSTRIWTRQEMYYARKMQVVWTDINDMECDKPPNFYHDGKLDAKYKGEYTPRTKLESLWAEKHSQRARQGVGADNWISNAGYILETSRLARDTVFNILISLKQWIDLREHSPVDSDGTALTKIFTFLKGTPMSSSSWNQKRVQQSDNSHRISQFLELISNFNRQDKYATKPRDYVLAIWPDCPVYEVPLGQREMSPGQLLDDALQQLEHKAGIRLATHAPAFLFDDASSEPQLWKPSQYLDQHNPKSIKDIYSVLSAPSVNFSRTYSPLHPKTALAYIRPRGTLANTLGTAGALAPFRWMRTAIFGSNPGSPPKDPWEKLQKAVAAFDKRAAERCTLSWNYHQLLEAEGEATVENVALAFLMQLLNTHDVPADKPKRDVPQHVQSQIASGTRWFAMLGMVVDFDELAFKFTCTALGLDPAVARSKGLRLMVREQPPMLGLTRAQLSPGGPNAPDGSSCTMVVTSWSAAPVETVQEIGPVDDGDGADGAWEAQISLLKPLPSLPSTSHPASVMYECKTYPSPAPDHDGMVTLETGNVPWEDLMHADDMVGVWVPVRTGHVRDEETVQVLFWNASEGEYKAYHEREGCLSPGAVAGVGGEALATMRGVSKWRGMWAWAY